LDAEIGRMERQRMSANKKLRALRSLSERSL